MADGCGPHRSKHNSTWGGRSQLGRVGSSRECPYPCENTLNMDLVVDFEIVVLTYVPYVSKCSQLMTLANLMNGAYL